MRTTLDIPEKLIDEAMKVTGSKTKSQLIKNALKAQINEAKRKKLITLKGSIDMNIDLDSLRDRG
ncbi:MAG: type II toxin-antitoxin system VapB family antitoxin [Balneola sp.]